MFLFNLLFLSYSFEEKIPSSLKIQANKRERYSYCLCAANNFDRCKSSNACDSYHVPQNNYITINSRDEFTAISKYNNSDITIYITSAGTDPFYISLNGFENSDNILRFQAVDLDSPPNINIRENKLQHEEEFQCMIQGVRSVSIDQEIADIISVLTLKNSPLSLTNSINIRTLVTDSQSIKSYQGTVNIIENLTFSGASPVRIAGKLILQSNSSVNIQQSSSFPTVSLRDPIESDDQYKLYVCLSDEYEDNTIRLGIKNGGSKIFIFKENSEKFPSISISNRLSNPVEDLGSLQFDFLIPSQGMNLMFNKTSSDGCIENFPEGFYITIGEDTNDKQESQTDASLLQLSIDKYCGTDTNFPITRIDGNINLRLMTTTTVQAILSLVESESFTISNLDSLTINTENFLTNILFTANGIQLDLGGGNQGQNSKNLKDDNSITLKNDISETYYIICSSKEVNFGVEGNIDSIHELTVITHTENASFTFSPGFDNKYAKNITISHQNFPVTVSTTDDYVPTILLDNEILNVSYESKLTSVNIANQSDANLKTQRAGPIVTYTIGSGQITFSQEVCLAKEVTFDGNDFKFDYINEAISSYKFNRKVCILHSKSDSNVFKAKSVTLGSNAAFLDSLGSSKCQIDATIGDLICKISAIPSDAFTSSIKIYRSLSIGSKNDQDTANQVIFSANSVRFDSSARIQQINDEGFVPGFDINLNVQKQLTLSYEQANSNSKLLLDSKELAQNATLHLHGNPVNLFIDKSWYNVNIPNSFKIVLDGPNTTANVHTELIELPNFSFYYEDGDKLVQRNDFNHISNKEPFVKTTAFKILIAFVALIGAAIIALIIVGIVYAVKRKRSGTQKLEDSLNNAPSNRLDI